MDFSSPSSTTDDRYLLYRKYLQQHTFSTSNDNSTNNSSFFGQLMLQACSSQAMTTFDEKKAPPLVIACCLALTIADCMVEQCGSLLLGSNKTTNEDDPQKPIEIVECSPLRLAALNASMNASCDVNMSLKECQGLAMTANLGLVAAIMISAFLVITLLCGLHMWATSKLRKRNNNKQERRGGDPNTKTPKRSKNAVQKEHSNSAFIGKRKSSKMGSCIKSKGLKKRSCFGGKLVPVELRTSQLKQNFNQSKLSKSTAKSSTTGKRAFFSKISVKKMMKKQ